MEELTKRYIDEHKAFLLYFGYSDIPYGLVYDEPITEDKLDSVLKIIRARMLEVIKKQRFK